MNKIICHIPLLQPFIHTTYFLEFIFLEEDLQKNFEGFTQFCDKDIMIEILTYYGHVHKINYLKKELMVYAEMNKKIVKQKAYLKGQFLDLKLYEAFLEGGPQSILQIAIIMQCGPSSYWQYLTISTSLLSFSFTATKMLLEYPTKVSTLDLFYLSQHIIEIKLFLGFSYQNIFSYGKLYHFSTNVNKHLGKDIINCSYFCTI